LAAVTVESSIDSMGRSYVKNGFNSLTACTVNLKNK
jgi:hypothetical protein